MELEKYLADVHSDQKIDSSGTFSIDLASALKQLTRYQLGDPHAYIQTLVSTAVLGGATFLEITTWQNSVARQGAVRYRFDGRVLEKSQLAALLGLQGDPFQRQFSLLLLHCLGLQPSSLRIQSAGGSVHIEAGELIVEDAGTPENILELGPVGGLRSRLNRLLVKPEISILRQSCALAPLHITVNGKQVKGELNFGRCLGARYIGAARHLKVTAKTEWEPVQGPKLRDWSGVLVIAPEKAAGSRVLIHGVAYPLPFQLPYPNSGALLTAPSLTLDISRSKLAENAALERFREELEEEFEELALEASLMEKSPELLAQLWGRHIGRLRQGESYPFARKLRGTPLYTMADESQQDLGTLVERHDEFGYLAISSKPWPKLARNIRRVWEPSEVVLRTPFTEAALRNFNCVSVDHLAAAKAMVCLPVGEYLLRMPLIDCPGEIGLWTMGAIDRYLGEIAEPPARPFPVGCQVAMPNLKGAQQRVYATLPKLYRGLVSLQPPPAPDLVNGHLLAYLCNLVERHPAKQLPELMAREEGLGALLPWVKFVQVDGTGVTLEDLLRKPSWLYREQPGGPPDALLLDHSEIKRLGALLPSGALVGHGLNHFSSSVTSFVEACRQLGRSRKGPVTSLDWLYLLGNLKDSAARHILEELGVPWLNLHPGAYPLDPNQAAHDSEILRRESLTSLLLLREVGACQISTDLLLLLLLRDPESAAARSMAVIDVTYPRVLEQVQKNMHYEAIADLDKGLMRYPNAMDFRLRHDLRVARGEAELAAVDLREAFKLDTQNKNKSKQ